MGKSEPDNTLSFFYCDDGGVVSPISALSVLSVAWIHRARDRGRFQAASKAHYPGCAKNCKPVKGVIFHEPK